MSNTKLFLISTLVILVLAGIPQLVAFYNPQTIPIVGNEVEPLKEQTSPLLGLWKATYDSEQFKGAMIVNISMDLNQLTGYAVEYQDELGNSETTNELVLELTEGNYPKWSALYQISYENEVYRIPCSIELLSDSRLLLSYDYYGHKATETWTKLEE